MNNHRYSQDFFKNSIKLKNKQINYKKKKNETNSKYHHGQHF